MRGPFQSCALSALNGSVVRPQTVAYFCDGLGAAVAGHENLGYDQTKVAAATRYWRVTRRTAGALSGVEVRAGGDLLPFRDLFRARICDIPIKGQSVGAQQQESRGLV
jgi:hypothetical protein